MSETIHNGAWSKQIDMDSFKASWSSEILAPISGFPSFIRVIACFAVLSLSLARISPSQAQITFRDSVESELITAPREVRGLLEDARKGVAKKQWGEATLALGTILGLDENANRKVGSESGTDYFVDESDNVVQRSSVRKLALSILESLPDEGAKFIEVRYGVVAAKQLEIGLANNQWSAIREVAERYPFTQAGRKASWILAERFIGGGDLVSAALLLDQMLESPRCRSEFGTDLGVLTVACWKGAGSKVNAVTSLRRTLLHWPKGPFAWAGKSITLAQPGKDLEGSLGVIDLGELSNEIPRSGEWLSPQGRNDNNGHGFAGAVLPIRRWHQRLHPSSQDTDGILKTIQERASSAEALIPTHMPILEGNQVIVRTYDQRTIWIDLKTGKIQWANQFDGLPVRVLNDFFTPNSEKSVSDSLLNSVWGEAPHGQLSSDGERVYGVCEISSQQAAENLILGNTPGISRMNQRSRWNVLRAWSFMRQGLPAWEVGDESGLQEPALAGALFLGTPVLHQGVLLTLCEINGEVFLVALKPETGKLAWRQQLIANNTLPIAGDPIRRNLAASPAVYGNIVVCPTLCGYVIAFDLSSHSLLWASKYQTNDRAARRNPAFQQNMESFSPFVSRSVENSVVLAAGALAYLPPEPECEQLIGLNVRTGEPLWPAKKREWKFVGGIWDDKLILVGNNKVDAISLSTGAEAWKSVDLAPSKIVGRTARNQGELFVPLANQEIARIDLKNGKVQERLRVEDPLGNLVASESVLISITPANVFCYAMRDRFRADIDLQFISDPKNPRTLALQAEVLFADGNLEGALQQVKEAYKMDPSDLDLQSKLMQIGIAAAKNDFSKYGNFISEFDSLLVTSAERSNYLTLMINGYLKERQLSKACELLLDLLEDRLREQPRSNSSQDFFEPEKNLSVQLDRWISSKLEKIYELASDEERTKLNALIEPILNRARDEVFPIRRRSMLHLMGLAQAQDIAIGISKELIRVDEWGAADRLLSRLRASNLRDEKSRDEKVDRALVDLYLGMGRRSSASTLAAISGVPLEEALSKGTDELVKRTRNQFSIHQDAGEAALNLNAMQKKLKDWPTGHVQVKVARQTNSLLIESSHAEVVLHQGTALADWSVKVGNTKSSIGIIVEDPWGTEAFQVDLELPRNRGEDQIVAHIVDNMIFLEMPKEIVAIDAMHATNQALLWRTPMESTAQEILRTEKTKWGEVIQRKSREYTVLAASSDGLIVRAGDEISCLKLDTGERAWVRKGISKSAKGTRVGQKLYVLERDLAQILVLDLRDGDLLERQKLDDPYEFKTAHGKYVLSDRKVGDNGRQGAMKLWDVTNGKVVAEQTFAENTVANVCDGRFLIAVEPTSEKAWSVYLWDLESGKAFSHPIRAESKSFKELKVVRFQEELVLLPVSLEYMLEIDAPRQDPKFKPVAGPVIAISIEDGRPLWKTPAEVYGFTYPLSQCRRSPLLFLGRVIPKWPTLEGRYTQTSSVALVDVRDGHIIYQTDMLPNLRNAGIKAWIAPSENSVTCTYGGNLFEVKFTDGETPPSPIAKVGKISAKDLERLAPGLPKLPPQFDDLQYRQQPPRR